jgi:hypothetical protein
MLKKLATWSIRARNGTEALCFGWVPERICCRHTTVGAQIRKKPTVELRDAVSKLMRDVVRRAQMTCLRGQQSENGIRKTLYLCTTRRTFGWIEAPIMLEKLATWSIRARNGTEALCFGWVPERIRCRHTTVGAQIRKKPTGELRAAVSKLMRDVVRRAQMTV